MRFGNNTVIQYFYTLHNTLSYYNIIGYIPYAVYYILRIHLQLLVFTSNPVHTFHSFCSPSSLASTSFYHCHYWPISVLLSLTFFFPLSIISFRSFHVVTNDRISLFLMAESLGPLIQLSDDGWGCARSC